MIFSFVAIFSEFRSDRPDAISLCLSDRCGACLCFYTAKRDTLIFAEKSTKTDDNNQGRVQWLCGRLQVFSSIATHRSSTVGYYYNGGILKNIFNKSHLLVNPCKLCGPAIATHCVSFTVALATPAYFCLFFNRTNTVFERCIESYRLQARRSSSGSDKTVVSVVMWLCGIWARALIPGPPPSLPKYGADMHTNIDVTFQSFWCAVIAYGIVKSLLIWVRQSQCR